jgi:hypothetical protein
VALEALGTAHGRSETKPLNFTIQYLIIPPHRSDGKMPEAMRASIWLKVMLPAHRVGDIIVLTWILTV